MNYLKRGLQGLLLSAGMLGLTGCGGGVKTEFLLKSGEWDSYKITRKNNFGRDLGSRGPVVIWYDAGKDKGDDAIYLWTGSVIVNRQEADAIANGIGKHDASDGTVLKDTVDGIDCTVTVKKIHNRGDNDPTNNLVEILLEME